MKLLSIVLITSAMIPVSWAINVQRQASASASCTTASAMPQPTGIYCNSPGQLKSPSPSESFKIGKNKPDPGLACRNACLDATTCVSFSYNSATRDCVLSQSTLKQQKFQPGDFGNGFSYWNRACFVVTCNPTNGCTPVSVQRIKNPSAEQNNGLPWQTSGDAARIITTSAYDGTAAFKLIANETQSSTVKQTVLKVNTTSESVVRLAYLVTQNSLDPSSNLFCQLDTLIGQYLFSLYFYGYDPVQPSYLVQPIIIPKDYLTPSTPINITLHCFNQGSGSLEVLLDSITLTQPSNNCGFVLQASGGGPKVNGRYVLEGGPLDAMPFAPSYPNAAVWTLDSNDPYGPTLYKVRSPGDTSGNHNTWFQYEQGPSIYQTTVSSLETQPGFQAFKMLPAVCSVDAVTEQLSCSVQGNSQFSVCLGGTSNQVKTLGLTGNQTCMPGDPITLRAVYV